MTFVATPADAADGMRLFGEALVLYLKSLSMVKTAITWAATCNAVLFSQALMRAVMV